MRLAADVTGEGEAVLLVHGFPDTRDVWRRQAGPLVEAGFRVIAPDLRGYGASARPEDYPGGYRITELVGDMAELLDEHAVERAHVVGHDWGAVIAWVMASLLPARVASLAALSVGHPNTRDARSIEAREKSWYMLLFQFAEAEELLLRDGARLLREWLADAPDAEAAVARLSEPGALTAQLGLYRANVHPRAELETRPLPPVAAPALGLWSTGDRYLTEEPMVRSGEHVTGRWRYERIEGASHWLQLDAPDRVNRLLLEHLRS
jgi:pimeloyl-ACP methyl ester carboxylesterase